MRFGSTIRFFCSILFIVSMVLYLPVAIYVPALTFNQVSGLSVHTIGPIVCVVCIFYTCAGGLKAVVWTDVIQSFSMYATVLIICIKGTLDVGGLGIVIERNIAGGRLNIPTLTWDPTVRLSMASVLIGGTLHKIQSSDVNQVSIQRFMSLPGLKQVRYTVCLFTIFLAFLLGCCCYMGLIVYATYHDCDPLSTKLTSASDQLPTLLAMRILGAIPGLPGCFVAGVFSAALSSLSTGLNSLSCVVTQDVIKPLYKKPISERAMAFILRFIVIVFGVICIALVFVVEKMGMVLQFATMTGAVCMGPLLAVYTLGVCCPWINEKSALCGSIVSFLIFGWICTKAQFLQMNGEMHHPKLPVSVEGCTYDFSNITIPESLEENLGERNIYHLSFLWYTGLGCLVGVVVAFISTIFFGTNNIADIDPALISPVLRRFLPNKEARYSAVNLKEIIEKNYLEKRFDRRVRYFGSILHITLSHLWMPIGIYVPAITLNMVSGIDINVVIPIVCVVCIFYTCIGGIKGVIWTDVLQSFIMISSLLFVVIKGTMDIGGLGVIYQRNKDSDRLVFPDWTLDPTTRMGFLAVFVGGTIFKLQGICISQSAAQRFFSLPNMEAVKKALTLFIGGMACLLGLSIYVGLLAYAKYYDCDPMTTGLARAKDQIVPLYVMEIAGMYPGIPGLFVSGVMSAALSSLSTVLNSLSAVVLTDFIEPRRSIPLTERQTAIALRCIVIVSGLSAMAMVHVVKHLGLVMQLSSTFASMISGPVLGIYTVGILLPFINAKSVFTGCTVASAILGYIVIRAQIEIATGELQFPTKPVFIDGCDYDFSIPKNWNTTFDSSKTPSGNLHQLSFLSYALFGSVMTIVVSLVATLFFGKNDTSELDPKLVMPFIRRFLKSNIKSNNTKNGYHIDGQDLKERGYIGLSQFEKDRQYFARRFSRRLRLFGAGLFVCKAIIWLPIAIYVPAITFSQVSGVDVHLITPIVIVICTFYTTVGGLKGVVWTDVVQSFVMYGTMILLVVKGTIDIGGLDIIWQRNLDGGRLNIPPLTLDPTVRMSMSALLFGGIFFKVQSIAITQPTVQRFMSLPSLAKVKQTLCLFLGGVIILYLTCVYVGMMAYANFHDCDPIKTGLVHASDQLVPLLVMRILGRFPGLPGLFVSAVFSAALSSLSTLLNSLSAVILEDFVKPHASKPLTERTVGLIMRSVVVVFGLTSIGLVYVVEHLGLVMQLSGTLQSVLYGPMLGIFTMGLLMPWINEKSALVGCTVSFFSMCWICANAQINQVTGAFRHPKLPVSVDGCDYEFDLSHSKNITINSNAHDGYALYHISFLWYTLLGTLITIIVANVAALFFGFNNVEEVDESLLVPFVVRMIKKRREYQEVSLGEKIELSTNGKAKL